VNFDMLGCFGKWAEPGSTLVQVVVVGMCSSCGDAMCGPEGGDEMSGAIRQGINKLSTGGSVDDGGGVQVL